MSFSSEVKNEILKHTASARHCQLALMAAYVQHMARLSEGNLIFEGDESQIKHVTLLVKKLYDIEKTEIREEKQHYILTVYDDDKSRVREILLSIKMNETADKTVSSVLIKNSCCKKSYLQGMFLVTGSVTDPEKGYHLEFVNSSEDVLKQIQAIMLDFDIPAKITVRKNLYVLYVKEGQMIVDFLNVIGAHRNLMDMENSIIMKDFRNNLNRQVNCETANLLKAANTGSRQKADIEFLRDNYGLDRLPDGLKEIAVLRLKYPDISLKELGEMMDPPLGKSGVNHRLRKLSELRDTL